LTTANRTAAARAYNPVNQFVAESLMVPFAVVMGHELFERPAEVPFAQRNDAIETFLFDRANKPLRAHCSSVRGTVSGPAAHQAFQAQPLHRGAPLAIPITDEKPLRVEHTSAASVRSRPIWTMNASSGCGVEPTMRTRRECNSVTNNV
jgi:hypothetical protein